MVDAREELLNRLTLVGWFLLAANGAIFTMLVPLLLFKLYPAVLLAGGRVERYAVCATFMVLGGAGFFSGKWLLERCGITVLRPPAPDRCCPEDALANRQTKIDYPE